MEIQFWYSDILPNTNIRNSIEKIDNTILFKNIDTDKLDNTKLNFLVFLLETEWTYLDSKNTTYTHSNEFIELLIKLQSEKFYFMTDNTMESELWVDKISSYFFTLLKQNKIDFNKLIIMNNDSSRMGVHRIPHGNFTLITLFFPHFFLSTYNHMKDDIGELGMNTTTQTDKKFLCLNRRMSYQKYQIIEELYNRGLLNDTRFTWIKNNINKNLLNTKLIKELNVDLDNFKPIQLEDDVVYNSDLLTDNYLYTINPNWYYKSKVNIITETTLYKNSIHLTEKTWKAIYLGIPFVIYAPSKHYLKTLRDMGFKTFNSVINEDYDTMIGRDKIIHFLNSAEELANIYNTPEVLSICEYNQKLYFNVEHREKVVKESFLNKLCDVQNLTIPKTLI